MVGMRFEDEIEWVVLKVEWDDSVSEMMVYYYDAADVEGQNIDASTLDEDSEQVERSSVSEVQKWIAESNKKRSTRGD